MPRTRLFKVGAATVAATAGVVLAITSVTAHSTQTAKLHVNSKSVATSTLKAEEQKESAAAAAALLAAQQRKAAQLAAKAQAEAAESAAEAQAEAAEATEPADTTQTEDKTGLDSQHDFTGEETGDN